MTNLPYAKKSLGQHWLHDTASLEAMCDEADLTNDDVVLEIGPGPGTLTQLLTKRARHVIAVELDERLAVALLSTSQLANVEVVQSDILKYDLTTLPKGYKIIANIPYYLTSHLFRILSESSNPPVSATLLVQKEVAERVAASPGDMSLLSVTTQYFWEVRLGRTVSAKLFSPPPKVDSQILFLNHRNKPLFPEVEARKFFHLVKAGFANRRKTLLNSLGAGLQMSKLETAELLARATIDPNSRAQELSLEQWHKLYQAST